MIWNIYLKQILSVFFLRLRLLLTYWQAHGFNFESVGFKFAASDVAFQQLIAVVEPKEGVLEHCLLRCSAVLIMLF